MTVIVWDGKALAADKRANMYGYAATVTKISRATDGSLLGFSGDFDVGCALVHWYNNGADPAKFPDNTEGVNFKASLLVIRPDRVIHKYERLPIPMQVEDRQFAMGSGRDYALAVLHLGHDAETAVRVVCELDVNCGNGIDLLQLRGRDD